MTVQSTQLLHLAEETSDLAQDGGLSKDTTDNIWDARYNKIKNLLDPTDPGDAVTLSYITKKQTGLLTQLNTTGDAQNSRLTSTGDAQNKRLTDTVDSYVATMTTLKNTATDKATEATNQAALAKKWAVSETSPDGTAGSKSSKVWADTARSYASNAATSEANASKYESSAKGHDDNASVYAQSASSSATAAASSATKAATSATNAKTSETNAATSATAAAKSAETAKTFDPSSYYKKTETYTKAEVDNKISTIDLSLYALKTDLPTKTSQLTNDSGFATVNSSGHLVINGSELWIE